MRSADRTTSTPSSRRRRALAAAVALATASAAVVAAAPADAASTSPKHPRVAVVAASDGHLVYRQKTGTAYDLSFPAGSALSSTTPDGHRRAVADFDPELFPTLQGSTLVQTTGANHRYQRGYDPTAPEQVRWRDLRTGANGVAELPAGDDLVGAAPGGWIATRAVAGATAHVVRYSTDGSSVDLGAPIAGDAPIDVRPAAKGVLVHTDAPHETRVPSTIRYLPYRAGAWRTVYAPSTDASIFCSEPSATHVVCEVDSLTPKRTGEVLLALDGGRRVWVSAHRKTCPTTALVAVGSRAIGVDSTDAGVCVRGRITELSAKGVLTLSKRTYGKRPVDIAEGLGGVLLSSSDQRRILRLTGARATPRTVATAR